MRVAIFASGNGTNFEVLADKFAKKEITGNLVLLFVIILMHQLLKELKNLTFPMKHLQLKNVAIN